MTLDQLYLQLTRAWSPYTCFIETDWDDQCPAKGQCAITALVVQDYFGGDLLRTVPSSGGSHYYNRLPDGTTVDLTRQQFSPTTCFTAPETRTRDYLVGSADTFRRYCLLRDRVA